ncbi:5-hydroxyisourate hydrolase [Microbacterium sp. SLBN-154]|uniref:hydroxyisourate hydrolase n=1 Tax=Microbacterium sp. SLBN-154 TaxID=2768458 RepID=UPI00115359DE|nr:hydroxyisourate hydrolase [Microbacterium sp. SLBN-154]TQK17955.1 5-hydroxyisourate hydrolase [Microbacterium sp. SLBN-154]
MTGQLTTHVLDASTGFPASGVAVVLSKMGDEPRIVQIASGETDLDGRLSLGPEFLDHGTHVLSFATGAYYAGLGVDTFYPSVTVTFRVTDDTHLHVPLLLSPFSYSTYRGS